MSSLQVEIASILKAPQLCNFASITTDGEPWVRYVYASANDDLTIQFATCLATRKVEQIKQNSKVHLSCGAQGIDEMHKPFLQIQGHAVIDSSKEARHAFWNDMLAAIYQGPDDPNYAVVKVEPYRIELWTIAESAPRVWER